MPVSIDSTGFNSADSPGPTWSFAFTNTAGTLLAVGITLLRNVSQVQSVSAITYNGVSLTAEAQAQYDNESAEVWSLKNPATGSNTLAITQTVSSDGFIAAFIITVTGERITGFIGDNQTARVTAATSASLSFTAPIGSMGLAVCSLDAGSDQAMAHNTGTELNEYYNAGHDANAAGFYASVAPTMSYSWSASSTASMAGVNIVQLAIGSQLIIMASKIHEFVEDLKAGLIPPRELQRRYREAYHGRI